MIAQLRAFALALTGLALVAALEAGAARAQNAHDFTFTRIEGGRASPAS